MWFFFLKHKTEKIFPCLFFFGAEILWNTQNYKIFWDEIFHILLLVGLYFVNVFLLVQEWEQCRQNYEIIERNVIKLIDVVIKKSIIIES